MKRRTFLSLLVTGLLPVCLFGCSSPIVKNSPRDASYVDAVEIRLKCRELADQLLATMPNSALQGYVAMPTSFVDQNNTERSSKLGRLIAETLFYEFNQRGFPTREYRLTGRISVRGARDDLVLVPDASICSTQKWASIVLGTYLVDEDATFINARLVRASDGLVMRTAQLVLVNTPIVARLAVPDKIYSGYMGNPMNNGLYTPIFAGSGAVPLVQQR